MTETAETNTGQAQAATAQPGRRRWWPRFKARGRTFARRSALLLGPIVLTALLLWLLGILLGSNVAYELLVLSGASLAWFGNTVIVSPAVFGERITLGTWDIALWLMYMNVFAAFFYAYNLDLLEKVPVVGPFLRRARVNATESLEHHKWIRRLAAVGVAFFVVTPLPGSGQLGGCFVGRVIGLTRRTTFLVVSLAGVAVCVLYAMFGNYVKRVLDDNEVGPVVRIALAVVVLLLCWILGKLLWSLGRKRPAATGGGETGSPA